jgi:hypothetical protein
VGAQNEFDAMRQRRPEQRFVDEVGGTDFIGARDGRGIVLAGDHHDGDVDAVGERADPHAHIEALPVRQLDIKEYEIGSHVLDALQSVASVVGHVRQEARLTQRLGCQQREQRIVIDDQNRPLRIAAQ